MSPGMNPFLIARGNAMRSMMQAAFTPAERLAQIREHYAFDRIDLTEMEKRIEEALRSER